MSGVFCRREQLRRERGLTFGLNLRGDLFLDDEVFFFFFPFSLETPYFVCENGKSESKPAGNLSLIWSYFPPSSSPILSSYVIIIIIIVCRHNISHNADGSKKSPVYEEARMHFSSSSGSRIVSFYPSSLLSKFPRERKPALKERRGGITREIDMEV